MSRNDAYLETPGGRSLAWLADAPLFIDQTQIASLYNAVARPEHETAKITLSLKKSTQFEIAGKASVEGEVGIANLLKTVFPFLDAKAKVGGELAGSRSGGKDEANEIELRPIDTPQRQLVQLALHYFINLPDRTQVVSAPFSMTWLEGPFITSLPRGLVFVEFPPLTAFVPMAVEIQNGNVQPIYPDLVNSFVGPRDKINVPTYPEPAYFKDHPAALNAKRQEYWIFFRDHFNSTLAMEAIEKKVSQAGGLIRWIDYRVPVGEGMPYLHLTLSAQGRYDTGTFAYRLVKRGFKHGLRVVGTMKSEPAMNVLAIFER